jgi:hypothetical protein
VDDRQVEALRELSEMGIRLNAQVDDRARDDEGEEPGGKGACREQPQDGDAEFRVEDRRYEARPAVPACGW